MLQDRSLELTPSHRLIADRIVSDPEGVAFMTISELGDSVNVNKATVARFATGLGLDGYPQLVRLCRDHLQEQAHLVRRFSNLERLSSAEVDPLRLVYEHDQANLSRTFSRIDRIEWSSAVEALATAPRVHVLGLRKCYAPAFLLSYLLGMLRDDVYNVRTEAGMLTDDIRQVRPGDCFVALSIHRYTNDTVRGFRAAAQRGARTIALTDNAYSPLAAPADQCFYIDTAGVSVLRSVTAFTAVVQALATSVAANLGQESRESLSVEETLLDEFSIYARDANDGVPAKRRPQRKRPVSP